MTNEQKNVAPIGSMWMGYEKDLDGDSIAITVRIDGDIIEGNNLRAVMVTSRDFKAVQSPSFIGKNWFRKATRIR